MVSASEGDAARALAAAGAVIVVVGDDGAATGTVVRDVTDAGGRAVAFVGDPAVERDAAALSEMVAELFPS